MVGPKRLELLHELVPTATTMGLLVNPTSPNLAEADTKEQQVAARTLGVQLAVMHASSKDELDAMFAALAQRRAGALIIGN